MKRNDWLLAASKRSYAIEDLPEAIIDAVRAARMDKRHDHLNKLMAPNPYYPHGPW